MEAEERRRLILTGGVTALQANIRGYLVRKRFQSLQEEYENVVEEIEGDLDELHWKGHLIPTPVFLQKKKVKLKQLSDQETISKNWSKPVKGERKLHHPEILELGKDCNCRGKIQHTAQILEEAAAAAISGNEGSSMRLSPEPDAAKPTGKDCNLPGEREEQKDGSDASSVWSSSILETGSPRVSQEFPFTSTGKEMPQTLPELQRYRSHLAMELLWLQQAIVSRKNVRA
uniref:IQ domain-containing protein C n=1 Tax=Sphenodon punctatus TaxID=8508 RepID=A0A8D0LBT8_SPHPU